MAETAIERAHSREIEKPYRPNFLVGLLYRRVFSGIEVDPQWVEAVRNASESATVVYVMRSVSYLDFVALDFLLKKFGLPLIRFVTDMGLWILEPFRTGLFRLFRRREPEGPALERCLRQGQSALLFMRKPQAPTAFKRRGQRLDVDHVRVLIEMQRQQERPILLMPQVFVWGKSPDRLHKGIFDQIFGPQEYPGQLRVLGQLVLNTVRAARLRACEPINLKEMLAEHPDLDDAALVSKIHWLLVTRLDRERRVVLGPMAKTPERIIQEVFRNPRVRRAAEDAAQREKKDLAVIDRDVRNEIRRLAARPSAFVTDWFASVVHSIFNRIYDGVEVDEPGLLRVREAARQGPIVLLPSHKSHIDYLLVSYLFHRHGLQVPHIAAGDNLAFWPAGPILRRAGAFFIRRKFGGARMYGTLVDAYVRKLLREGYPIEIFIEGGRSRTGKLLAPKLGLLSMVVEAAESAELPVFYVPIAIGYEKIVEETSYVEELRGGEKRKEDASALASVPRLLSTRYGKAYLHVGEIIRVDPKRTRELDAGPRPRVPVSTEPPPPPPGSAGSGRASRRAEIERIHQRRAEVASLARRVAYEINRVTPVTPNALVATVLLVHRRRGIERSELLAMIDTLAHELRRLGARFASSLAIDYEGGRRPYRVDAIDHAIQMLADAGEISVHGSASEAIYAVPDDRRLKLDYYKNNVVHFFVPWAMLAAAVLAKPRSDAGVEISTVRDRFALLSGMLANEFAMALDPTTSLDEAIARLVEIGDLEVEGEGDGRVVRVPAGDAVGRLRFHAGQIRNFLESRRIAIRALGLLTKGSMPAKDLVKRALAIGDRMFLAGELVQREAVSKPNLENALATLREDGIVVGGDGGPQRLVAPNDTEDALRALEEQTAAFC